MKSFRISAFSLIELLVVMTIVLVLITAANVAFHSASRGAEMTRAAHLVNDQLVLAHQEAAARNSVVEVRFDQADSSGFKRLSIYALERKSSTPVAVLLSRVTLPAGAAISNGPPLSPLIGRHTSDDGAEYYGFAFTAHGSLKTSEAAKDCFFTLVPSLPPTADVKLPANYAIFQVLHTGKVALYRP